MDSLKTLDVTDAADVGDVGTRPHRRVDASMFLGSWTSTNRDTQGISRLAIREDADGQLFVRAFGACGASVCDWGEARVFAFADDPSSTRAYAFTALFDLGFKKTSLQGKIEKGVLVVANFNRFKDGNGRANFFGREFFFRPPASHEGATRTEAWR